MIVHLLCSSPTHPVVKYLKKIQHKEAQIKVIHSVAEAIGGDILYLVSCSDYIKKTTINLYKKSLVLHASDLPKGRGWSPHIWEIVNGGNKICLSLLEVAEQIDTGDIWKKMIIQLEGHELYDEINDKLFSAEVDLITWGIDVFTKVKPEKQGTVISESLRKRTPDDSKLSIDKTIQENFNLLRVCDPERFPAFFNYLGHDYKVTIEKIKKD